jgi:long-subunit acyl-CoA synthetase (AMP-forming)
VPRSSPRRADGAPEYYGDADKTASIRLPDGRFTVGDLGWLDDGFLDLADRRVDLILIAGSNVYPAEIEAVLSEHPSVADVLDRLPREAHGKLEKRLLRDPYWAESVG